MRFFLFSSSPFIPSIHLVEQNLETLSLTLFCCEASTHELEEIFNIFNKCVSLSIFSKWNGNPQKPPKGKQTHNVRTTHEAREMSRLSSCMLLFIWAEHAKEFFGFLLCLLARLPWHSSSRWQRMSFVRPRSPPQAEQGLKESQSWQVNQSHAAMWMRWVNNGDSLSPSELSSNVIKKLKLNIKRKVLKLKNNEQNAICHGKKPTLIYTQLKNYWK